MYTDKVSCVVLGALRQRKYNKPEVLPLAEDLLTLKSYQQKVLKQLTEQLEQNHAYDTYNTITGSCTVEIDNIQQKAWWGSSTPFALILHRTTQLAPDRKQ